MSHKILLVEDDSLLSGIYKMKLEKAGFEVVVADDGEKGVSAAKEIKPDLVLLDLVLPKMDGIEVCRRIRENDAKVKICFLTNISPEERGEDAKKAGADGYIVKTTCTPTELVKKVKEKFFSVNP